MTPRRAKRENNERKYSLYFCKHTTDVSLNFWQQFRINPLYLGWVLACLLRSRLVASLHPLPKGHWRSYRRANRGTCKGTCLLTKRGREQRKGRGERKGKNEKIWHPLLINDLVNLHLKHHVSPVPPPPFFATLLSSQCLNPCSVTTKGKFCQRKNINMGDIGSPTENWKKWIYTGFSITSEWEI